MQGKQCTQQITYREPFYLPLVKGINATLIGIGEDVTADLIRNVSCKSWQKKKAPAASVKCTWRKRAYTYFINNGVYLEAICKFNKVHYFFPTTDKLINRGNSLPPLHCAVFPYTAARWATGHMQNISQGKMVPLTLTSKWNLSCWRFPRTFLWNCHRNSHAPPCNEIFDFISKHYFQNYSLIITAVIESTQDRRWSMIQQPISIFIKHF